MARVARSVLCLCTTRKTVMLRDSTVAERTQSPRMLSQDVPRAKAVPLDLSSKPSRGGPVLDEYSASD